MLRSYLTLALRAVRRRPLYTALNIAGLAIGMTACLLIGLYVDDELRYDTFHAEADRLVRIGAGNEERQTGATPPAIGATVRSDVPQAEAVMRTLRRSATVQRADAPEAAPPGPEQPMLMVDGPFFEAFSFPLVAGDPATALDAPDAVVLTASTARTVFGDADPIGQSVVVDTGFKTKKLTVTAVAGDPPRHSTIAFGIVAPLDDAMFGPQDAHASRWGAFMLETYVLLREGTSAGAFEDALQQSVDARLAEFGREGPTFFAMPLPSFYLSDLYSADGFQGQWRYVLLFGTIAAFILLIAAINYVNLVTAQAARRAQEVGVRKVMGARRGQIAGQFVGESVLLSAAALVVAWGVTALGLPAFGALFGKTLTLDLARHGPVLAALSGGVLAVGALAGVYPAVVLARFAPVQTLRGRGSTGRRRTRWLYKGLVVTQFAISVALIACTAIVYNQLQYVQDKNLGFDGEQAARVTLPDDLSETRCDALTKAVRAHPNVQSVSVANGVPGGFSVGMGDELAGFSPAANVEDEAATVTFKPAQVDTAYLETLGLEVLAGRGFTEEDAARTGTPVYVLNETAAGALGWTPDEAVGKPFGIREEPGTVIGVVKDFHLSSMREAIEPVSLQLHEPQSWGAGDELVVRFAPDAIREGLAHVETSLAEVAPQATFDYRFLDDTFDAMYRAEERLGSVFLLFAGVAILVACLGLFGLATYAAEQRTKEVGIRKALGATAGQIVRLLTQEFAVLVAVAFVVAAPAAYWGMSRWLADFAYRLTPGPGVFVSAGGVALALALVTVGTQALRAARTDPARALRAE